VDRQERGPRHAVLQTGPRCELEGFRTGGHPLVEGTSRSPVPKDLVTGESKPVRHHIAHRVTVPAKPRSRDAALTPRHARQTVLSREIRHHTPMLEFEPLRHGDSIARAYIQVPDGARAGVVVLHAWWGLNDDVMAYADRLAKAGYAVIAPDMFGGQVATERADAERLAKEGDAGADAVAFAAVDHLAERLGPGAPLAVLGFSFGAAYALWAPSERDRITAAVVYYGTYTGEFLAESKAPVLGHFAENDEFEPEEGIRELEQLLTDAGREVTIHRYPGTGHWFAEPSRDAYDAEAAELAFRRTIDFLGRTVGNG
jgi:carboxymethylenebutenolidase